MSSGGVSGTGNLRKRLKQRDQDEKLVGGISFIKSNGFVTEIICGLDPLSLVELGGGVIRKS